jgi:hypothetical protein
MVVVAQLVERRVVVPDVGGSSPLDHPIDSSGPLPVEGGRFLSQRQEADGDGTTAAGGTYGMALPFT